MSRPNRHILYVSRSYKGHVHDYSILRAEFNPAQGWFSNCRVRLDLGFQGFADDYCCDQVVMAHKRKRVKKGQSNELSVEQKVHNKIVNGQRVAVEHSLAGMDVLHYQLRTDPAVAVEHSLAGMVVLL